LYNHAVVLDARGIAPKGWHVPTFAEWNQMVTYLGGNTVAGGAMKEVGTAHWINPNTGATNSSGFTALGSGVRDFQGNFQWFNVQTWWQYTNVGTNDHFLPSVDNGDIFYGGINYEAPGVDNWGKPIRLIKDQ